MKFLSKTVCFFHTYVRKHLIDRKISFSQLIIDLAVETLRILFNPVFNFFHIFNPYRDVKDLSRVDENVLDECIIQLFNEVLSYESIGPRSIVQLLPCVRARENVHG